MSNCLRSGLLVCSLLFSSLFAGPKIEFDTKIVNCGTVYEGISKKLDATFAIKNSGDSLLKIHARVSCGCTIVKYDSLIAPGKTIKMQSAVTLKGITGGPIAKTITITSNAKNEPTARLTIAADMKSLIEISEKRITMYSSDGPMPHTIYLTSRKSDLNVTGVQFQPLQRLHSAFMPYDTKHTPPVKFTYTPTDTVKADGYRVFKLDIFVPAVDIAESGEFSIKTNYADKPEVVIYATILK